MAAGLNRVTWNLDYAPATTFPGMILWGASTAGPAALPGDYQVRLTVDGKTQTQPLTISKHPLRNVSDADLKEQFDLAIQIRDKVSEANNAVIQIRRVKQQVVDRLRKSSDPQLKAAGETADREPERGGRGDLPGAQSERPGSTQLPDQDQQPAGLAAERRQQGRGKPIASAYPIFKDLTAELKVQTDRLRQLLTTDLSAFNEQLRTQNLEPIPMAGEL